MKFCKDCKYYLSEDDDPFYAKCGHDKAQTKFDSRHMVNGSPIKIDYNYCTDMRIYRDLCSKKAKLFEAK